jgi:hypothetical protein
MEATKFMLGALIFVVAVIGINLVIYAMVRGAFRPGSGKGFLDTFSKSLNDATRQKDTSLDELHRRVEGLKQNKKEVEGDSE